MYLCDSHCGALFQNCDLRPLASEAEVILLGTGLHPAWNSSASFLVHLRLVEGTFAGTRLIREGKMPTLQQLTAAVLEARRKYANQIRRARREAQ